ncbi:hypothetical protein GCM10010377_52690 [Streptomyces viridiviolaceus]|nr:hypothetical protein GCM10010377_52690 [Streptomyces viridiviolaceus]
MKGRQVGVFHWSGHMRLVVVVGRPLPGNRHDSRGWEESGAKAAVGNTTIADGARRLDRPTSAITREVMRNAAPPPTSPTWSTAPPNAAPTGAGPHSLQRPGNG